MADRWTRWHWSWAGLGKMEWRRWQSPCGLIQRRSLGPLRGWRGRVFTQELA